VADLSAISGRAQARFALELPRAPREDNARARPAGRGIIVAKEITEDLKLAASRISGIQLIEYEIEFKLRPI
jgi:hypothetical protein